jgi:hypothetical protein
MQAGRPAKAWLAAQADGDGVRRLMAGFMAASFTVTGMP